MFLTYSMMTIHMNKLVQDLYEVSHPYNKLFFFFASSLPPKRYSMTVIGHKYNMTMLQLRLVSCIYITAEFPNIFFTVKWTESEINTILQRAYSKLPVIFIQISGLLCKWIKLKKKNHCFIKSLKKLQWAYVHPLCGSLASWH